MADMQKSHEQQCSGSYGSGSAHRQQPGAAGSTHLQLQGDAAHGAALDALHQVLQQEGAGG